MGVVLVGMTGIPCDLAALARVPLRFAKGRGLGLLGEGGGFG